MNGAVAVAGAIGFLCGSLMFSYWCGLLLRVDLRGVGDGNPGAVNLWKAAGSKFRIAGAALDFLKGYLFVLGYLHSGGMAHGYLASVVLAAPVAGHMFSPWMKFRGGKGIAVTFGVWSALTDFRASVAYGAILLVLLIAYKKIGSGKLHSDEADGVQVVFGMLLLIFYLAAADYSGPIYSFWMINLALLAYAHLEPLRCAIRKLTTKRET